MAEVLRQDEIDALLRDISSAGRPDPPQPAVAQRVVRIYDFKRPPILTKYQVRAIGGRAEVVARRWAGTLSDLLLAPVVVRVGSVDTLTFEEFTRSVPTPTTLVGVRMEPLDETCWLEFDPSISFAIVDLLLGGDGGGRPSLPRPLTVLEDRLLTGVVGPMVSRLADFSSGADSVRPRIVSTESDPSVVSASSPREMVVLVTYEAKVAGVEGMMNLCLPAHTAAALFPSRPPLPRGGSSADARPPAGVLSPERLRVDVAVYTPAVPRSIAEWAALKPGDIVELDGYCDDSLRLSVGDREVCDVEFVDATGEIRIAPQSPEATAPPRVSVPSAAEVDRSVGERLDRLESMFRELSEATGPNAPAGAEPKEWFAWLADADALILLSVLLDRESPRVAAVVAGAAADGLFSAILAALSPTLREVVPTLMATTKTVGADVVSEIEGYFAGRIRAVAPPVSPGRSRDRIAAHLRTLSYAEQEEELARIGKADPGAADRLRAALVSIDDIATFDDRSVQRILREIDTAELAAAYPQMAEGTREIVERNMSTRAVTILHEEVAYGRAGSLTRRAVGRIETVIRRLRAAGDLEPRPTPDATSPAAIHDERAHGDRAHSDRQEGDDV